MSSKFSHRKTRVQHKPKVCISEKPQTTSSPPPAGHVVNYSFTVGKPIFPFGSYTLVRSGTMTEGAPDGYIANGLDDAGQPWQLAVTWAPAPTGGHLNIHSDGQAYNWQGPTAGWFTPFPWGPVIHLLTPDLPTGNGVCSLTIVS